MAINYVQIIGEKYPAVGCHCIGDGTNYSSIIWDSGDPIPDQATLDNDAVGVIRAQMCDLVDAFRNKILYSGYTDANSITWDTAPEDIQNLAGVCALIACGAITTSQTWRDANNTNHTMTPTQLVMLAGGITAFGASVYANGWTHKGNINALTDVSAIQSYDYTTGWPSN